MTRLAQDTCPPSRVIGASAEYDICGEPEVNGKAFGLMGNRVCISLSQSSYMNTEENELMAVAVFLLRQGRICLVYPGKTYLPRQGVLRLN